jgi:hypothetical protein
VLSGLSDQNFPETAMRIWSPTIYLSIFLSAFISSLALRAQAQVKVSDIALKSGESADMGMIYWITRGANCRSTLEKIKGAEILEGPPELAITIKEEMVLPRNCATKVPGGKVILAVSDVKAPFHGRLVYRIKYQTKDGDRQSSYTYNVSLYPN